MVTVPPVPIDFPIAGPDGRAPEAWVQFFDWLRRRTGGDVDIVDAAVLNAVTSAASSESRVAGLMSRVESLERALAMQPTSRARSDASLTDTLAATESTNVSALREQIEDLEIMQAMA